MDLYQRQQFETLLETAIDRFSERLEQRNEGAANALLKLRDDPEADGVWLGQFTSAIFQDFLLNNIEGAAFVLSALPKRMIAAPPAGTVDAMLQSMAQTAFSQLLRMKVDEELERRSGF